MITKSLRKLIVKEFRRQIFPIAIIAVAAGVGAGIFYFRNNRTIIDKVVTNYKYDFFFIWQGIS